MTQIYTHSFVVYGLEPYGGKKLNALIKMYDLGLDGVYTDYSKLVTVTYAAPVTCEGIAKTKLALIRAYEECGFVDIRVVPKRHHCGNNECVYGYPS